MSERLLQFLGQLEQCHHEAVQIAFRHLVWKQLREVVRAAPWTLQPPQIWQFITESHLQAVSLWIRRSVDHHGDSISVYKLIRRVALGEVILRRSDYVAAILGRQSGDVEFWRHRANLDFDKWAGFGAEKFPSSKAERHKELLKRACKSVTVYVDQRLAHHDRKQPEPIHIQQIDRAFGAIMSAHKRYHLMMTGEHYALDEPILGLRWKDPLTTPWLVSPAHEGLCMPLHPEGRGPPHRWNRRRKPGPWRQ